MKRNVGGMGESTLSQWCSELGVPCNRAVQDRGGWDYLIEFDPVTADANTPIDRRPAHRRCLVQVKATDSTLGRRPVKLSNWQRLVTSPLPAFFLVLEFDGRSVCQRAYLVHVWDHQLRAVLRRLRQLSRDEPSVDLRKRSLALSWSPSDQLHTADASGFRAAMEDSIGGDPQAYAERKRELLNTLGYEAGSGEFTTQVRAPPSWEGTWHELFADLQLGLIPSLETRGGAFWDSRFGIKTTEPQKVFTTIGKIEPGELKPVRQGVLELRSKTARLQIDVEVFVASLTPVPPSSLSDVKWRLRFPFGDIVSSPHSHTATVRWTWPDEDEPVPLADLVPLASLLDFLGREVEPIELVLLGSRLAEMSLPVDAVPDPSARMAKHLTNASRLAAAVDASHRLKVTLLDVWQQSKLLDLCANVLAQRPFDAKINFSADEPDAVPTGRCASPHLLKVRFFDQAVWLPVLHVGDLERLDESDEPSFRLVIEHSRVATPLLADGTELVDPASLISTAEELARGLPVINLYGGESSA